MSIALVFDAGLDGLQSVDWSVRAGALAVDDGLRTHIAISLFTDAAAAADDVIPDGGEDRRGWWGDTPPEGEDVAPIGSRLWLLSRELATEPVRRRAEDDAGAALAWMVRAGIAAAVDVTASFAGARGDQLRLVVTLRRATKAQPADPRFEFVWSRT